MPNQRFTDIPLAAASQSVFSLHPQVSSYAVLLTRTRVMRAGTISAHTTWPSEAIVNLRSLARGVSWALTIEGAAALGIYGVWYLCRLWL